jgi:6-phosphogluconolactonase
LSRQEAEGALRLLAFSQAAPFIAERIRLAVGERGVCSLVLAGGRTPRPVYERLARPGEVGPVPWEGVRLFWGDERFVPPGHEASNFRMARETLLLEAGPPARNLFPIPTDSPDSAQAARRYERTLRGLFPGSAFPVFDLVLLGLGADGHTASLFPGGPECEESFRWCVASRAPEGAAVPDRLTLTLPVLNAARCVAFLVAGADKRGALQALLRGAEGTAPAERIHPAGGRRPAAGGLPAQRVRAPDELFCFTDLR